jgi:hypothetical protein
MTPFHKAAKRGKECPGRCRRPWRFEPLETRQVMAAAPVISEFLADNTGPLIDEDGEAADWIEITNQGDAQIDLAGWSLTDNGGNLGKWHFPSTLLNPSAFLTVFASNKDRAVSGSPLHTNFRLDADGEFLALVRPDSTIASQFTPTFPRQIESVSYGIGQNATVDKLVVAGDDARVYVPTDDSLGLSWTGGDSFNDSAWQSATTGLGFESNDFSIFPPAQNPYFYGPYGPGGTYNLYQLVTTPRSFADAHADAQSRTLAGVQGHLATIHSTGENSIVRNARLASGADLWIGLTDRETYAGASEGGNTSLSPLPPAGSPPGVGQRGNGFAWVTGEPLTFMNWASAAPNDAGEDYATMTSFGQWNDRNDTADVPAGLNRPYVVEYELGLPFQPGGAATETGAFQVQEVLGNGVLNTLADALSALDGDGGTRAAYSSTTINHRDPNTNGSDHFTGDLNFATNTAADDDDFALRATAILEIPTTGDYTFGVTSDDGFRLRITGGTFSSFTGGGTAIYGDILEHAAPRGPADSLGVLHLERGAYPIELITYERGGGAMVELYAAAGAKTAFDGTFRLVGQSSTGGLGLSNYGQLVATDLEAAMHEVSSSVYVRMAFDAVEPQEYDLLKLRIKYEDGFVAYLNGTEVARRNAPAALSGNSAATATRPTLDAIALESIDISGFVSALRDGENILAFHGLNRHLADGDFLLVPELEATALLGVGERYFANPTPGAENDNSGVVGVVQAAQFSREHGFYQTAFSVVLSTETEDAEIRYTTDGSAPTLTSGLPYTDPIPISTTTTLRAAAFKPGHQPSPVATQTYLFLEDVVRQTGADFPPSWGAVTGDYAMDPAIVNSAAYRDTILNDLKALPTISIVTDRDGLFGPTGIYTNPLVEGDAGERAASVEVIYPDGREGTQVDAALQMFGGFSRNPGATPKHSFRLVFKREFGPTRWDYPLFGEDYEYNGFEVAEEFNTIVLRANFNDSWAWGNGATTHNVDEWSRRTMMDMGARSAHGTFMHLYVNGLYWGLYNPTERHDAEFMASYEGGVEEQWDTLHTFAVRDGNATAWNTAHSIADGNLALDSQYQALAQYVDIDNLIDYTIMNIYGGNWDWPHNNWDAARYRDASGRFRFFSWDAEGNLSDVNADRTDVNADNSPGYFYDRLRQNAEFRLRFADHLHKHFFNGGALTPAQAAARFQALNTLIDRGVVAESARWGDARREPPFDRNGDWMGQVNYLLNSYFPARTGNVLNQFRADGLYPTTDAPVFSQHGGTIDPGFQLNMSMPGSTQYNNTTLVAANAAARTLVPTDASLGLSWVQPAFVDTSWTAGPLGVGYDTAPDYLPRIGTNVQAQMFTAQRTSAYIRSEFNLATAPNFDRLLLRVDYDDGFVAYLNGTQVAAINAPASPAWNSTSTANHEATGAQEFDISQFRSLLASGKNVLAIHGLNGGGGSSDFLIQPQLIGQTAIVTPGGPIWYTTDGSDPRLPGGAASPTAIQFAGPLTINDSRVIKSRALVGGVWSALNEATFSLDLSDLRVTEIMYNPAPAIAGPFVADDFEFIELANIGTQTLDLSGVHFHNGIQFTFPEGATLAAGARVVVVSNPAAFESRYGTTGIAVAGSYTGRLDDGGERLTLAGKFGDELSDFRYSDQWHNLTDGVGFSLVLINELADTSQLSEADAWRPSAGESGSPGADDDIPPPGAVIINEILANSTGSQGDRIELHNTTLAPIDVGGWFLSDSPLSLQKYQIPDGTVLPPNSFVVFDEATSFGQPGGPGVTTVFSLSAGGGELFLASSDPAQHVGGYQLSIRYDGAAPGDAFGAHVNSLGETHLVPLTAATFGAANSPPRVGPVVINEIMYHPPGYGVAGEVEYIELLNTSPAPVPLFDPANPENTWRLLDGVSYTFPTGVEIPAGGYLLVVDTDPEVFRAQRGLPPSLPIYGPFTDGRLSNGGEEIELYKPGEPLPGPIVPLILIERIEYDDDSQWPTQADGLGSALIRSVPTNYGDDAANWTASRTGGTPGTANIAFDATGPAAPTALTTAITGQDTAHLEWNAAGDPQSGVSGYQVFRDGLLLATTAETTFDDTTLPLGNSFSYEVRAINGDGVFGPKSAPRVLTLVGIDFARSQIENRVQIQFSQNVTAASATNLANYAIDRGISVMAASLAADQRTVTLSITSVVPGSVYTLSLANIVGTSGNVVRPGSQTTFTLGEPGFVVHMWDVNGGTNGSVDNTTEAVSIATNNYPAGAYTFSYNNNVTRPYLNFGGGTSFTAPPLLPYPNGATGSGSEHIVVRATSVLTIPVGTWTIDFGSDDGGRLLLPGVTFTAKYGQDVASGANEIRFEAGRGHGHTGGTFTVAGAPMTLTMDLVMFEGAGGDSLDFSVSPGTKTAFDGSFTLLQDGVHGWSVKTQGTPVNQPPVVVDVSLARTAWSPAFKNQFPGGAYLVPDGASQLSPLPWAGLDQIKIRFSEDVNVQAAHLTVSGVAISNYSTNGFSFDPATDIATWTLATPIAADKIRLTLDDAVTDLGSLPLDGEWVNSTSTFSGNGTAGGDLSYRFDVLPGNVNAAGGVDAVDLRAALDRQFTAAGQPNYDPRYDLDGNAAINILDWAMIRDAVGSNLPTGNPSPPAPDAAVVVARRASTGTSPQIRASAIDRAVVQVVQEREATHALTSGRQALRARRTLRVTPAYNTQ